MCRTQVDLAAGLGVRQSAIARWEGGIDIPSAAALLKLSELAPESERQWWRDLAEEQAGISIARPPSSGDDGLRMIPLLRDPISAGIPQAIEDWMVERLISFPRDWLPVGGQLIAGKVKGESMEPFVDEGDILIVDLGQRSKEELVGKIVIARLDGECFVKRLREVDGTYFLDPANKDFQPTTVKRGSGWEIVGCVLKWIKEQPGAMRQY